MPPMIGTYAVQRSLERHLGALAAEMQRRLAANEAAPRHADPTDAARRAAPRSAAPITPRGE